MRNAMLACFVLLACERVEAWPPFTVLAVDPAEWRAGERPELTITGQGFNIRVRTDAEDTAVLANREFSAQLSAWPLEDLRWQDNQTLFALPNAGLPAGDHALTIFGPGHARDTLPNAVRVQSDGGSQLFQDDFESGWPPGFEVSGGTWEARDGDMIQTELCGYGKELLLTSERFADAEVATRFRFLGRCGTGLPQAGLISRAQTLDPCVGRYFCAARQSDMVVAKFVDHCGIGVPASTGIVPLQVDTTYTLSLTVIGADLTCTLSGGSLPSAFTVSWTDPDPTWPDGMVGMRMSHASVAYEELTVSPQ